MKRPCAVYDIKDNELCVGVYDSLMACARAYNTSPSHIFHAIERNDRFLGRYRIMYVEGD